MKKLLVFDLGGVLIDLHVNRSFEALAAMGVAPSMLTEEGSLVNRIMQQYDRGDIPTEEMFEYISSFIPAEACEKYGVGLREHIGNVWNMMLGEFSLRKLQLLKELRAKGYRVVMLSNTNEAHWPEIERKFAAVAGEPLQGCFDALYLSYLMRLRKPEQEIFTRLLEREGITAAEAVFFDDSAENCAAARALGIEAVQVERNSSLDKYIMCYL